jgi:hypothetical protein
MHDTKSLLDAEVPPVALFPESVKCSGNENRTAVRGE